MKSFKLFLLMAIMVAFIMPTETQAQKKAPSLQTATGLKYDTLTNGETLDFYFGTTQNMLKDGQELALIVKADTLSGTDAVITAQTIGWISSETGWFLIGSAVTVIDTNASGAVITPENTVKVAEITHKYYERYGVRFISTGTATTLVNGNVSVTR